MTTTLQRVGDDLGLILDPATWTRYGITEATPIVVTLGEDGITLRPLRFATDEQVDDLSDEIMTAHAETLRKLALQESTSRNPPP